MKDHDIISTLREQGYVVFDTDTSDESLLKIASLFGVVVPGERGVLVQPLKAQEKGKGSIGSFTYMVGYDAFPWHTDTAYWEIPVRYLMLTSEKPSPCATLARSFESLAKNIDDFYYLAERSVYMLNIPGKRKLLSPVMKKHGEMGFRFDFHIYKPMNEEAKILSSLMLEQLNNESQRVVWSGNNVLVLDNWRLIHAREDASQDKNRSLKRIYINELV